MVIYMKKMTKRQRFLATMRGEPTDGELVWAPNFDYWLQMHEAQGTLPEKYKGMTRNDIVRTIDATIWSRATVTEWHIDPSIKQRFGVRDNGNQFHEIETPLGNVCQESAPTESDHSSPAVVQHFINDLEGLRVMTYVAEGTELGVNFTEAQKALDDVGEDGIVLHQECQVPLLQFAKMDAGYMNAFYLMEDYPKEVERLIKAYHKQYVDYYKKLSQSPADVLEFCDNMDELMISPKLFERYAIEFYQECKETLKGTDKILGAHWCGRTEHLLPYLPQTGIDVVEAVITQPMADITLERALNILDGKVALQGGIPAVLVCPDITSRHEFEQYIESVVLKQKGRKGFILGMSDNVPPDADFARVEIISQLIK